ncbi:MAG: hypothetical protein KAG53_10380 [Endozoicomonadaceae bacterium]|nr:hypothetical protein [Endozoicomonadaceae bacterium]
MGQLEIKVSDAISPNTGLNKSVEVDIKHGWFYKFFVEFIWNGLCHLINYIIESSCCYSFMKEREVRIAKGNERLNRLYSLELENMKVDEFEVDSDNKIAVDDATTVEIPPFKNEIKVDISGNFCVSVFMESENQEGCTEKVEFGSFKANKINDHLMSDLRTISSHSRVKLVESILNIKLFKSKQRYTSFIELHLREVAKQKSKAFFVVDVGTIQFRSYFTNENIEKIKGHLEALYKKLPEENLYIQSVLRYLIALKNNRYPKKYPSIDAFNFCLNNLKLSKGLEDTAKTLFHGFSGGKLTHSFDLCFLRKLFDHIKLIGNNPLLLEVHAGNGYFAKVLNENGISTIPIDACISNFVCEKLMQDVFFYFDADAIKQFNELVIRIKNKNVEVSPIIITNMPGGDLTIFANAMCRGLEDIKDLTVIIIGKRHLDVHLHPNSMGEDVQCTELTSLLSYVNQKRRHDKIFEYKLKEPSMFKTPNGKPIILNLPYLCPYFSESRLF